MHVSNLLGALEVVMEDIVADCQLLNLQLAREPSTPPSAARDAQRYSRQLSRAFALHQRLFDLARGGARGGGGKGKKSTATSSAPRVRGKAGAQDAPVEARAPQMTAPCLAALCGAITEDGLVQPPPGGWGGTGDGAASTMLEGADNGGGTGQPLTSAASGVLTGLGGGGGAGGSGGADHAQLVRGSQFRAFALSSCTHFLEARRQEAASAALLGSCGSGSADGGSWVVVCQPLFKLAKMIMESATPGGRHVGGAAGGASKAKAGKTSGGGGAGGSAASGGDGGGGDGGGGDTLELLAARALLQAVQLGDVTQHLLPLARAVAETDGGGEGSDGAGGIAERDVIPESEDQQEGGGHGGAGGQGAPGDSGEQGQQRRQQRLKQPDAELVSALAPLLRNIQECIDSLMRVGCFKAAHTAVQALLILGKRLAAVASSLAAAPAAAAPVTAPARQQQQPPADGGRGTSAAAAAESARRSLQALSTWGRQACQQQEPEVTHLGLVKALLEVVVRFSRSPDDLGALSLVASDIMRVVGDVQHESQATQASGGVPPLYPQPRRELKRELSDALARLPGLQGVLPGGDTDVKQRVLALVADLERSAPFKPDAPGAAESLLGEWSLVFASDGTVVTRAPPAQLLVQLASIPGLGLSNIQQQIDNPVPGGGSQGDILAGAGVSCSNGLSIGLGPFGTWQVRVKGHWLTTHQPGWRFSGGEARRARARGGGEEYSGTAGEEAPGLASEVAFDGFGIRLQGLFGLDLGTMLPEFSVSVPRRAPRAQANWRTTYCDGEWRVGRGVETGGVFLFKRKV